MSPTAHNPDCRGSQRGAEAGDVQALAMEFVAGDDLSDRTIAVSHGIVSWFEFVMNSTPMLPFIIPCGTFGSMMNVQGAPTLRPLVHNVRASSTPAVVSLPPAMSNAGMPFVAFTFTGVVR